MGKVIIVIIVVYFIYCFISASAKNDDDKQRNNQRIVNFTPNRSEGVFKIDDVHKIFCFDIKTNLYFKFDELESYKLYQDNNTLTSGSTGSVNIGFGLNLGGVSASSQTEVENLDLVVKFSGLNEERYTHHLLKRPARQSSEEYRLAIEKAEDSIEFLEEVLKNKE